MACTPASPISLQDIFTLGELLRSNANASEPALIYSILLLNKHNSVSV